MVFEAAHERFGKLPFAALLARMSPCRCVADPLFLRWSGPQPQQTLIEACHDNSRKLIVAQAAAEATDHAIQVMGGMGYAVESHVERLWRDAPSFRIAPVSEELALNYIGQHDLGMVRSY